MTCVLGNMLGSNRPSSNKRLSLNTFGLLFIPWPIQQFLCHWMCILEGYKCFLNIQNKWARQKRNTQPIQQFLCHWTCKLEGYKCSLNIKNKEARQKKHKKRMSDNLLQFVWKNSSRPISSSSPLFFSFLVCFEWIKT